MKEMVGGCCVCSDERGWTENPLVYCDGQGCTVAVHQACYGIVTVPTGPWFCRKCESQERAVRVRCELCPIRDGALKRTDNQAWAHVVCALYIPEVRFGNVTTMEPIILQLIPPERFNKSCYICEEQGKGSRATVGACMQCNKAGCKAQFHVTCAQGLGLLCEEAGNYMDNVKYCGYCQHHYSKLKKGGNVKQVPPYKPVANELAGDDKEEGGRKRKGGSGGSSGKAGGRGGRGNTTPSPNLSKAGGVSPSTASESGEGSHAPTPAGNTGPNGTVASKELLPPPTPTSAASVIKDPVLGGNQNSAPPQNHGTKFTTSNFVETVVTPSESVFGADQAAGPKASNNLSSNSSSTGKKRRSAGGIRTPPGTAAAPQELLDSGSSAPAPGSTSANPGSSVVKMDVDTPTYPSTDMTSVEKGVKKLKVVSEQNLSALSSSGVTSSPSLASVDPVTKGNSAPATQSSPSVTSSANSIVVSVPLTAAVSIPSTQGQTSSGPAVTSATSHSTIASQPSSTEATHYISSSNGTTTTFTKAPVPSISHDIHSASKRSRSQSAEKQDKRKTKRGTATPTSSAPVTTSTGTSATSSSATSTAPPHPAPPTSIAGTSAAPAASPAVVNSTSSAPVTTPSVAAIVNATAWPNKRGRATNPTTPPPQVVTPDNTTSSSLSKESPPSSPEPAGPRGRRKSQKNHQGCSSGSSNSSVSQSTTAAGATQPIYKEERDVKLFQNGVTSVNAPHMLGNQLNPASSMAQKMSDTLSAELEAHSIFTSDSTGSSTQLIGPPLPSRVISSVRSSSTHSAESGSGSTGSTTNKTNNNAAVPQTLDQLLERQWEQGSQFLMEQAQHFDIASLLTCLHQLRSENTRLEEHIRKLQQRRDHLLAVNARLAIPLTSQTAALPAGPQAAAAGAAAGAASTNPVGPPSSQIAAQVSGHVDAPAVIPGAVPALAMHVPAPVSNPVPSPSGPVQRSTQPPRSGYQTPLENGLPNDPSSHHPTYPQAHQRNPMERSHQSSAIRHAQPTGASYIMSQQTGSTNQGVGVVRGGQAPPDPGRRPGVGYAIYPPVPGGSVPPGGSLPPGGQFNVPSQQVVMRRDIH